MKNRKIVVLLGTIFGLAVFLSFFQFLSYRNNIDGIKTQYRQQKSAEVDKIVNQIDSKLTYFYQTIRTMSLLPAVKKVDRHGNTLNDDSKMVLQQLFNNAFLNIKMSEIYLIPSNFDVDKIDPVTKKNEEPIITFDEFRMTLKKDEAEKKPEIEQVEEFEYNLMKTQLAYLRSNFPRQNSFKDLDVPVISGNAVITCDNAEFTKKDLETGNNEPRNGFVFTVPTYDEAGEFHGGVSSVLRTSVLKSYLPELPIGIINHDYGVKLAVKPDSEEWKDSQSFFEKGKENPSLIFSSVRTLKFPDVHPWEIWVAFPEQVFWESSEVKNAQNIFRFGVLFTWILAAVVFFIFKRRSDISYHIKEVATKLMFGAEELAGASANMGSSSKQLKDSSVSQNSASTKVASAITEITSMVEKNALNAKQCFEQAELGIETSHKGQDSAKEMLESVKQIKLAFEQIMNQSQKNSEQLTEVVAFMKNVDQKTKVIDDIVFQTKLLSFNASVEAARAGEFGKGFAVVAEEIGNLAQLSGRSAQEIADLIGQGSKRVAEIVTQIRSAEENIDRNARNCLGMSETASLNCSEAIQAIVEQVTRFAEMAKEIQSATEEQEIGVNEISKAIHEIDSLTQVTGQISNSVSSVSDHLQSQANRLKSQVSDLGQLIGAENEKNAA